MRVSQQSVQPAADPDRDGAARLDRHATIPGTERVHALGDVAGAARASAARRGVRARHSGAEDPGHRARTSAAASARKIFVYFDMPLVLWLSKKLGPPGEVLRGPLRELPAHHPRPRPHHRHRGRRDEGRQDHRAEGHDLRQPRRLPLDDRRRHPDHALRADDRRLLQDPEHPRRRDRGLHQHRDGRRLPRRGPAGGDVRHRARLRSGRRRHRRRSGRGAAAQLHPAGGFPVRHRASACCRTTAATTSRRSTRRCSRSATQGLRAEQAARRANGAQQAARHRPLVLRRGLRRRALEVDRAPRRRLGRRALGERQRPRPPDRQGRR